MVVKTAGVMHRYLPVGKNDWQLLFSLHHIRNGSVFRFPLVHFVNPVA